MKKTLSAACAALVTLACGTAPAQQAAKAPLPTRELQMLAATYDLLKAGYAKPVSGEQLVIAAVRGMLHEIDPEGGEYFSTEELKEINSAPDDTHSGSIGLELMSRAGELIVISPIAGGPAQRAGLRPRDVIKAIDGQPVKGVASDSASRLLSGPVGSKVMLTVQRSCAANAEQFEIERSVVRLQEPTVTRPTPGMVVLQLTHLRERSVEKAAAALGREWKLLAFRGVLLDLRQNPGGPVGDAVGMAAMFLPRQAMVARATGATPELSRVFRAEPADYSSAAGRNPFADLPQAVRELPLVVLVDEGTASGAEIVVGALKDHRRATVVGHRTFGRGSIQTLRRIEGGAVKFTSAYWESPSGTSIHGVGITPDLVLDTTHDAQQDLAAALAHLKTLL